MQEHTTRRPGSSGADPVQAIDDMLAEIESNIRTLQVQLAAHDGARQALVELKKRLMGESETAGGSDG